MTPKEELIKAINWAIARTNCASALKSAEQPGTFQNPANSAISSIHQAGRSTGDR
jgi:hypothetical protein